MRRILFILLVLILITACATTAPATPTIAPTSQTVDSTETIAPTASEAATNIPTAESTLTSTPEPLIAHWYWTVNKENQIIAVNQEGETREVGKIRDDELENFFAYPIDAERALLVTLSSSQIHTYLLTLNGMQAIKVPALPFNELSKSKWSLPAIYGDHLLFSYQTRNGMSGDQGSTADKGPLLFIDLKSLTTTLLDKDVHFDGYTSSYNDTRTWAHTSQDGRYVRYLSGDEKKTNIREVDLATGTTRTIHTVTKHNTSRIQGSVEGELWYLRNAGIIFNINGNQTTFANDTQTVHPLRDGKALIRQYDCEDNCPIKIITPFTEEAEINYQLPWGSAIGHNPLLYVLLPNQDLISVTSPYNIFSQPPVLASTYPQLESIDQPVFRLSPDGNATLLGIYKSIETASNTIPVSTDGQYMLLSTVDQSAYFIYDTFNNQTVAELPRRSDMKYFGGDIKFVSNGVIVHITGDPGDNNYTDFVLAYSSINKKSFTWESATGTYIDQCQDLLPDNSLICMYYSSDSSNGNLVRYDPDAKETTTLLENAWMLTSY